MKNFLSLILILYSLLILSSSCNKTTKNNTQVSDTLIGKTIVFPKTLQVLKNKKGMNINSFLSKTYNQIKIISIIDGTCPKCITSQLNYNDSIFSTLLDNNKAHLAFILNVPTADSAYFMKHYHTYIDANSTILWDNNYNFERANKLFTADENLRTFMTNRRNKIVVYGNPLFYPRVIDKYNNWIITKDSSNKEKTTQ